VARIGIFEQLDQVVGVVGVVGVVECVMPYFPRADNRTRCNYREIHCFVDHIVYMHAIDTRLLNSTFVARLPAAAVYNLSPHLYKHLLTKQ
jgi:hypothetical protein